MTDKYRVILADPPWAYNVWNTPKAIMKQDNSRLDRKRVATAYATAYYPTMSPDTIKALPIAEMADTNCALFLWVTMPCLPQGLDVMAAWGFTYKTCAFTWVKTYKNGRPFVGLGHYTRGNAEMCLLGMRGAMTRKARDVPQILMSPLREHSRKPDEVYGRIMALFDGPYLEMFARQTWPGWMTYGNQTAKFPAQPFLFGEEFPATRLGDCEVSA